VKGFIWFSFFPATRSLKNFKLGNQVNLHTKTGVVAIAFWYAVLIAKMINLMGL